MDLLATYPGVMDLKRRAQARLPGFVWEYLDSGTGAEATKARNRAALDRVGFAPSILHGPITPDLSAGIADILKNPEGAIDAVKGVVEGVQGGGVKKVLEGVAGGGVEKVLEGATGGGGDDPVKGLFLPEDKLIAVEDISTAMLAKFVIELVLAPHAGREQVMAAAR